MDPIPQHQKKLPPIIVATPVPPPAPLIVAAHGAPEAAANEPDPPVALTKRTWLTKRPYKRQKKSLQPAAAPAPTAAPPPAPIIVAANAPEAAADEPDAPSAKVAAASGAHQVGPTHPEGIVIEIAGITACNQGRSCEEHPYCWDVIDNNVVVCLCHLQVIMPSKNGGPGKEVTAMAVYWVTNGIDWCRVGFLPAHMVKYAARYDGVLAHVTETFGPVADGNKTVHKKYHRNKGFCCAVIISTINNN
jgi:hypothetical protein